MEPRICLGFAPTAPGRGSRDGLCLLEQLYGRVAGASMPRLLKTERGKPYFASGPWHCSITHTESLVCCALAPFPLGVDGERLDRKLRPGLPDKVLAPGELEDWRGDSETLLTYWVLKEAYVKYTGQGLRGYPRDLCFRLPPGGPRLEGSDLWFRLLKHEDHILALCAPAPAPVRLML